MASFTSHTYNVTSLLGRASFPSYGSRRLVVPPFQRPFSWEKAHVSAFWEDIGRFHRQLQKKGAQETYFLGPIVLLPEKDHVKLLDGQQRLATLVILLAVLRDHARGIGGKDANDFARDVHRDYLLLEDEETFSLVLGELDEPFFKALAQDETAGKPKIRLQSHRLLSQAKSFLAGKVKEHMGKETPRTVVDELKAFKKTIATHVKVVGIHVESQDEAYLIFETLNDRGLRLGVPDLLLNYLMGHAGNEQNKKLVRQHWNTVVETLGTRRISTFVRHSWVSHHGDVKSQTLFREMRDTIEAEGTTSLKFASDAADESSLYAAIFDRDPEVLPIESIRTVTGLVHELEADYVLPALLAGLATLGAHDFTRFSKVVAAMVVRHSIITNRNPNDLETALYAAAQAMRKAHGKKQGSGAILNVAKAVLVSIDPTDDQLKTALRDVYLTKRQALYVLYSIAERMQSRTKAISLQRNSVEHIFPENPDAGAWQDAAALGPFVWHLGNLTILEPTYNRDAGGKDIVAKAKYYKKSDITMSSSLASLKKWDVSTIVARAEGFREIIAVLWPRLK